MRSALSIEEVKDEIGIGRTKIYQLIKNGELPARKLHNRTVVLKDDLAAFLQSLEPITPRAKS